MKNVIMIFLEAKSALWGCVVWRRGSVFREGECERDDLLRRYNVWEKSAQ